MCIVHIPNLEIKGHDSKFYNFHTVGCDSNFISTCDRVPEGLLTISHSAWNELQFNSNITTMKVAVSKSEDSDPKTVFENYQKDCVVQRHFRMPYITYMNCIIDNIIGHQDQLIKANKDKDYEVKQPVDGTTLICANTNKHAVNKISECAYSHPGLDFYDHTTKGGIGKDVYLPEKSHGHISLSADNCDFIGPDRESVPITNTQQYLRMAEIIRQTGLPNYRAA